MMRYSLRIIDNRKEVVVSKRQLADITEYFDKSRKIYQKLIIANAVALILLALVVWYVLKQQ